MAGRLAAIDIGTNSIRLIVAEPLRGGNYRILDEEKESTRLGVSLSKTGRLDPLAIEKSLAALRRMKQIAEGFQVTQLRTIATCAVREATNGDEFCRRAHEELGIDIEVITAKQEALLAFFSVQRAFDLTDKHVAVADIGGGSTEIVLAYGNAGRGHLHHAAWRGAARANMFGNGPGMAGDDFQNWSITSTAICASTPRTRFSSRTCCSAPAARSPAWPRWSWPANGQGQPPRGYQVTRAEVRHLLERLRKLPLRERSARRRAEPRPGRHHRGRPGDRRSRDGSLASQYAASSQSRRARRPAADDDRSSLGRGRSASQLDREAAIERLAAALRRRAGAWPARGPHGRPDLYAIGRRVRARPADRALLETAARLQDVGYLINYDSITSTATI